MSLVSELTKQLAGQGMEEKVAKSIGADLQKVIDDLSTESGQKRFAQKIEQEADRQGVVRNAKGELSAEDAQKVLKVVLAQALEAAHVQQGRNSDGFGDQ